MEDNTSFEKLDSYICESKMDEGFMDYTKSMGKQIGKLGQGLGRRAIEKGKQLGHNIEQTGKQAIEHGKNIHNQAKLDSRKQDLIKKVKADYASYREHFAEANKLKAIIAKDKKILAQEFGLTLDDIGIQTKRKGK